MAFSPLFGVLALLETEGMAKRVKP